MEMDGKTLVSWLFEYGGPAVRYRTARSLAERRKSPDVQALEAALLEAPTTAKWLSRLASPTGHLEGFRRPDGAYRFPAGYLRELPRGYWVHGASMRLDPELGAAASLACTSTFRVAYLRRLMAR